ncbi:hypothetical protein AVEN_11197-1 [Araneus ventricosus]|uniref:Uncharacterized protein n=1 Tax=Araneus ventricosus TaxID=182803 RepID=A0A4Y2U9L4_ARAVE|nr:hypothetical protein AVEN_11197-1 [Araneus ventricosus]
MESGFFALRRFPPAAPSLQIELGLVRVALSSLRPDLSGSIRNRISQVSNIFKGMRHYRSIDDPQARSRGIAWPSKLWFTCVALRLFQLTPSTPH